MKQNFINEEVGGLNFKSESNKLLGKGGGAELATRQ